jgi:hypothetical protein
MCLATCITDTRRIVFNVLLMQAKLFCGHHSVDVVDAVSLGGKVHCTNEGCSTVATYGYARKPAIYCKACIPEELKDKLIDVKSKRCEHEGCHTQASFGFKEDRVSSTVLLLTLLLITTGLQ